MRLIFPLLLLCVVVCWTHPLLQDPDAQVDNKLEVEVDYQLDESAGDNDELGLGELLEELFDDNSTSDNEDDPEGFEDDDDVVDIQKSTDFIDLLFSRINTDILERNMDPMKIGLYRNNNRTQQSEGNPQDGKRRREKAKRRRASGTLSGLSTIKRSGEIRLKHKKDGNKIIRAQFMMGPLALKVTRKFGRGPNKVIRTATATTEEVDGKFALKVTPDGKVTVRKVKIKKPQQINIDGHLARDANNQEHREKGESFLRRKYRRVTPVAARKIRSTIRTALAEVRP